VTLRIWAIKPRELKPLSRDGLLLLTARCAMRVEPWCPPGAEAPWSDALEHIASAAFAEPSGAAATELARELMSRGARAEDQLASTDEPLGRCMNYATSALASGVKATALEAGAALDKVVIESAKMSGSIAGVLAHAGRVPVSRGEEAVELACTTLWSAIRADIPVIAAATPALETARTRVAALRELAPLWVDRAPAWVRARGGS